MIIIIIIIIIVKLIIAIDISQNILNPYNYTSFYMPVSIIMSCLKEPLIYIQKSNFFRTETECSEYYYYFLNIINIQKIIISIQYKFLLRIRKMCIPELWAKL